jgi:hypothetical protein
MAVANVFYQIKFVRLTELLSIHKDKLNSGMEHNVESNKII